MQTGASSLATTLFTSLEARIRSGALPPGSCLPSQKDLGEEAGVSRTVVREAVARLVAQGLAIPRKGSGVYVSDTAQYQAFQVTREELSGVEDVVNLLELRLAVEAEMAGLAAARRSYDDIAAMRVQLAIMANTQDVDASVKADVEFHSLIARATKNDYFERFMIFLGVRLVPPRNIYLKQQTFSDEEAYSGLILKDHQAIFDAILDQNPQAARTAARKHLAESLERHARLGKSAAATDLTP